MCQKEATSENTERAEGTEKLAAKANDGKHKRKSHKSQKGGNEHKKSKNFECNAESKATEQPKPTTETADQEQRRPKREDQTGRSKKQLIGTRLWLSDRKFIGKWEIKRRAQGGEATLTELIDCAVNVRKSFAFLRSHPLGFRPFYFVPFSFPPFLFCVCLSSFLTSRVISSFSDCSNQSQQCFTFVKLGRNPGKHPLQWTAHPHGGTLTSASYTKMLSVQFAVIMNLIQLKSMKGICNH
jgi:hypothetical protein